MDVTRESLGRAIASIRSRAGLTQEALGSATGLGQTAISRIESGHRRVEATELLSIAEALKVEVGELFDRARVLDDFPEDEELTFEVLGLRIERDDPASAAALEWVGPFLQRLERLEELVDRE